MPAQAERDDARGGLLVNDEYWLIIGIGAVLSVSWARCSLVDWCVAEMRKEMDE